MQTNKPGDVTCASLLPNRFFTWCEPSAVANIQYAIVESCIPSPEFDFLLTIIVMGRSYFKMYKQNRVSFEILGAG